MVVLGSAGDREWGEMAEHPKRRVCLDEVSFERKAELKCAFSSYVFTCS